MGMDVYGKDPSGEDGKYFRNNVWWWRPLADYIITRHAQIAAPCAYWHTNDGDGLDADDAKRLGEALKKDLADGTVAAYIAIRQAEIDAMPNEPCIHCAGTGQRDDKYVKGKCNGCDGAGSVRPFDTHYPMSEENVREFANFCTQSGGFEIC